MLVSPDAFLYENSTDVPVFFGTNQSAVMFFSETLNLCLINIAVTHYYGFAIIAANPYIMDLPYCTACIFLIRQLEDLSALHWLSTTLVGTTPAMGQECLYIPTIVMSHPSQNIPTVAGAILQSVTLYFSGIRTSPLTMYAMHAQCVSILFRTCPSQWRWRNYPVLYTE